MVAPWRGLAIKCRESAAAIPHFSLRVSEGSRAEAALSPAGRCAKSAGESAAAIPHEGSRTASVRSVRSVFINHGLFGLNGDVNENEIEKICVICFICVNLRVAKRRLIAPKQNLIALKSNFIAPKMSIYGRLVFFSAEMYLFFSDTNDTNATKEAAKS